MNENRVDATASRKTDATASRKVIRGWSIVALGAITVVPMAMACGGSSNTQPTTAANATASFGTPPPGYPPQSYPPGYPGQPAAPPGYPGAQTAPPPGYPQQPAAPGYPTAQPG